MEEESKEKKRGEKRVREMGRDKRRGVVVGC